MEYAAIGSLDMETKSICLCILPPPMRIPAMTIIGRQLLTKVIIKK